MTRDVAGLLVCNALFFVAGAGLVRLFGGWRTPRGLARLVGVSYLAGIAAVGVTLQLLLLLGMSFNRSVVIGVCIVLGASGLAARRPVDPAPRRVAVPAYMRPLAAAVIFFVVLMFIDTWFQPLGQWDAWAQWTAKARSLVIFEGLNVNVFENPAYHAWNPDYPLLIPSIEASDFTFMRQLDTLAIHLQFTLVYAGFLLALLELLRGRVRETLVWPFVLAIAVAPTVEIGIASALADIPVAIMFALAGVFAWRWLVDADRVALRLFALFGAGAFATKFEGRIFILALSVTLITLIAVTDRVRLRATIVAVVASLVGLVPWWVWVANHHVVGAFSTSATQRLSGDLVDKVGRIPTTLASLGESVFNPSRWLLLGFVIVAVLVISFRLLPRSVETWLFAGTVGLSLCGLILVYMATPLDLHSHLYHSARRVVSGPVLFASVLAPLLLEAVLQAPSRGKRDRQYPLPP